MTARTPAQVWDDYLFLTREMAKFLAKQDFAMFMELSEQRERLQTIIEKMAAPDYLASPRGREIQAAVSRENKTMLDQLRLLLNKARQDQTVSQAYDLYGAAQRLGSRMDQSR